MAETRSGWLVRLGLYTTLAAIPFEIPRRMTLPVEIPTLAGALFIATALLEPRRSFGRVPAAVWWFVAYLCAFAVSTSLNFLNDASEVMHLFLLLVESVLVFWAAANVLENDSTASGALLVYAGACLLRAVLPIVGVGRTATVVWTGGERVTAFGQNENNAAMFLAAGVVAVLGIGYARARTLVRPRALVLVAGALIAYASVETGSRGGLIALVVGLVAFALARGRSTWTGVRNLVVALAGAVIIVAAAYQTPVMRNRLLETAESGAMAGREGLYPLLGRMFVEKPFIGWGPMNNQYELSLREGNRRRPRRDAHNIVLETLTSTGLIGTVAFCVGLWLCVQAAWRARLGPEGVLPLALLGAVLTSNMSGNWMASKILWFALAYAVASARRATPIETAARDPDPQARTEHAFV